MGHRDNAKNGAIGYEIFGSGGYESPCPQQHPLDREVARPPKKDLGGAMLSSLQLYLNGLFYYVPGRK